jgi:hypothetical protein
MFSGLESGKTEAELQEAGAAGGLSLKRNPLVVSIMDGCDTLKALASKDKVSPALLSSCKGLILMRTDKVRRAGRRVGGCMRGAAARHALCVLGACSDAPAAAAQSAQPSCWCVSCMRCRRACMHACMHAHLPADRLWHLSDAGLWPGGDAAAQHAQRLVSEHSCLRVRCAAQDSAVVSSMQPSPARQQAPRRPRHMASTPRLGQQHDAG